MAVSSANSRPLCFSLALLLATSILAAPASGVQTVAHRFDWERDTFAFANDTFWVYAIDAQGNLSMHAREKAPEYSRRCFVMCRATLQFFKFVRFEPHEPRLSPAEYRRQIRTVSYIPVWLPRLGTEVVIPGYADLRSFSKDHTYMLEEVLGNWWPSYFRVGNWRMALPFPRTLQEHLAWTLIRRIDKGQIQAVFLTRFRPINHCIIAYYYERLPDGNVRFLAYDPNDAKAPVSLTFDQKTRSFAFPRTGYFNGGRVNAFQAYLAPWQ